MKRQELSALSRLGIDGGLLWQSEIVEIVAGAVSTNCAVIADGEEALIFSGSSYLNARIDRVTADGQSSLEATSFGTCEPEGPWTRDDQGRLWTFAWEGLCEIDPATLAIKTHELTPDPSLLYVSQLSIDRGLDGTARALFTSSPDGALGEGTFSASLPPDGPPARILDDRGSLVDPFNIPPKQVTRLLWTDRGWTAPSGRIDNDPVLILNHDSGDGLESLEIPGPMLQQTAVHGREMWIVVRTIPGTVPIGSLQLTHPGPSNVSYYAAIRFRDWDSVVAALGGS